LIREEWLKNHNVLFSVENMAFKKRIDMMTTLLDDTMAVFKTYLNVPEANAVRDRWLELRNELEGQTRGIQAGTAG
jgi:hypothetical protein